MADLVNEFSWSRSRAEKFQTCARAYYFHYYGSWGGWERNADPKVRELYVLKKLTNRYAWAGSAVHDIIAWALSRARDRGALPPLGDTVDRMRARMRLEFKESRDGLYEKRKALGLVEHAYEEDVPDSEWLRNFEHAQACLTTFYESQVAQEILATPPDRWLPIDSLASFTFEGTRIYVAPDFAFRDAGGRLRILDWKTGRPKQADHDQVLGYALFALDQWGASVEDCSAELWYLGTADVERVPVSAESLERFRQEMRASIADMKARLVDPERNLGDVADFTPAAESAVCGRCNFRRACPQAVLTSGSGAAA